MKNVLLAVVCCLCVAVAARAEEAASPPAGAAAEPAAHKGILPIPDYTGPLVERDYLAGDLWGLRSDLAQHGVQADVLWTQTVQGVVDGGRDTTTRYNTTLDYNLLFDLQQMGVMPGALVKFRAESRFGNSVNTDSGSLLPVNTDAFFPLNEPTDDDIDIAVTNLTYIQFLSPRFGLLVGKIDTLDGDPVEFASGRGTSQFMNGSLVFNPVAALSIPYSTLAFGAIWKPCPNVTINSTIMNRQDSSTSSGFDDFGDGWLWSTEAQVQYRLGDLPGGFNVGFLLAGDCDFIDFSGRLVFNPGDGFSLPRDDDTWAAYASVWQYLWVKDPHDGLIDLTNGEQDLPGIGLFARFGVADDDTNPINWTLSVGLGAKGILPTRERDTLGVGYVYADVEVGRFLTFIGIDDDAHAFEAYYNIAITPAVHLTFDVQVLDSPLPRIDTTTVVGGRLSIRF